MKLNFKIMVKRLTKSYDRIIAGVCGGLSEYINPELDPLLMRIAFAVITFFLQKRMQKTVSFWGTERTAKAPP